MMIITTIIMSQLQFNFMTHSLESPVSYSLKLWSHSHQSTAFIHSNSEGLNFPAGPQRAQERERARISLFWYGQLPDVDRRIIQIERAIWAHVLNYSYRIRLQTMEKKTQEERQGGFFLSVIHDSGFRLWQLWLYMYFKILIVKGPLLLFLPSVSLYGQYLQIHQLALPYHTENNDVLRMMINTLPPKMYQASQWILSTCYWCYITGQLWSSSTLEGKPNFLLQHT